MSWTLHGHFISHSFQTGLPFYSPLTPQTTSLVFPLPFLLLPPSPITANHVLLFLAPENLSVCSHHPIRTVTPAMAAIITSRQHAPHWSSWFSGASPTTPQAAREGDLSETRADHVLFTDPLWYLHLQTWPYGHCYIMPFSGCWHCTKALHWLPFPPQILMPSPWPTELVWQWIPMSPLRMISQWSAFLSVSPTKL